MILLNFGWMVDLAMSIFEFLTKFLIFWHPWHPWVCIRSDLKQIWAIPHTVARFMHTKFSKIGYLALVIFGHFITVIFITQWSLLGKPRCPMGKNSDNGNGVSRSLGAYFWNKKKEKKVKFNLSLIDKCSDYKYFNSANSLRKCAIQYTE